MKSLSQHIQEAVNPKPTQYKYFPKTKDELKSLIKQRIQKEGNEAALNDTDEPAITAMPE